MSFMLSMSGMTCSGKTYTMEKLLEIYPDEFIRLPCYTTREPRPGEKSAAEGGEYVFISDGQFNAMKAKGDFFQLYEPGYGTSYGTTTVQLVEALSSGKVPVRLLEPPSVGIFKNECEQLGHNLLSLFVHCPLTLALARLVTRAVVDGHTNAADNLSTAERIEYMMRVESGWEFIRKYDMMVSGDVPVELAVAKIHKNLLTEGAL